MTQETWTGVDQYITDTLIRPDGALSAALRASADAGLPAINVSPPLGKLLHVLALARGAQKILEIGTLGGYSTIWLARALPRSGKLITLEFDPKHADVARANIARAGLANVVEIILGRAIETLPRLASENRGPFDLIFIDADKQSTPEYFTWALKLSRPGSLIIVDNVIRKGSVVDASNTSADVQGIRRFNEMVAKEERVSATAIQTVGVKGYDGFAIVLVTGD
jgi:predicted O-methyltransferase YrrM